MKADSATADAAPRAAADAQRAKETRPKRQQQEREELEQRYGMPLLERPAVQAELKVFAWRMARLERMRELASGIADEAKRTKTLARLEGLESKEQERHERHMSQLRQESTPALASAEGSSANAAARPEHADKLAAEARAHDKGEKGAQR